MLKKKSALSYKFVCVATHRCGGGKSSCKSTNVLAIMPVAALGMGVDVDVVMSGCVWLQSFHTLQGGNSSVWVWPVSGR